jgi:hypothetical protein
MGYDAVYVYQPWERKTQPVDQTCDSCHVDHGLHYTNIGNKMAWECLSCMAARITARLPSKEAYHCRQDAEYKQHQPEDDLCYTCGVWDCDGMEHYDDFGDTWSCHDCRFPPSP